MWIKLTSEKGEPVLVNSALVSSIWNSDKRSEVRSGKHTFVVQESVQEIAGKLEIQ